MREYIKRLYKYTVYIVVGLLVHSSVCQLPQPVKHFLPITDFVVFYSQTEKCPQDYEEIRENLNSGANGSPSYVKLCYRTGDDKTPISDISFTRSRRCPSGYEFVKDGQGEEANLNRGTFNRFFFIFIIYRGVRMCYLRSNANPIYHLRLLNKERDDLYKYEMRALDLNAGLGDENLYVALTRSKSMLAATLSLEGKGPTPKRTLAWSSMQEDASSGNITVDLRWSCNSDWGCAAISVFNHLNTEKLISLNTVEANELCESAMQGVQAYWSGPVVIKGVERYVSVNVINDMAEESKDVSVCRTECPADQCNCFERSINVVNDPKSNILGLIDGHKMVIYHQAGVFVDNPMEGIVNFKYVAAHEIGHSFLSAYNGVCFSAYHKDTSDFGLGALLRCGEPINVQPECPATPGETIDIMKYYNDEYELPVSCNQGEGVLKAVCPNGVCCAESPKDKHKVINDDRARMLMAVPPENILIL
jgi:hypothetical protein